MVSTTPMFERMSMPGDLTVDRELKIIRNVKLLGFESRNLAGSLSLTPSQRLQFGEALGHPYTYDATFGSQVAEQYNGLQVYIDHPVDKTSGLERSVKDLAGVVENVSTRADGIYGDIAYFETTSGGQLLAEIAERQPRAVGCSHAAGGRTELRNNRVVVAEWAPRSVDIVTSPGTTTGLNESLNQEPHTMAKTLTIASILEHKSTTKLGTVLREMADAGMIEPETPVDEMEPEGEPSPEDQVKAGIVAAIMAKLDSASDDEVLAVLSALGMSAPLSGDSPAEGESDGATDTDATESLKTEIKELKATTLLLEAKRKATPERIEAVAASTRQSALVNSWPQDLVEQAPSPNRPHRSPPAGSASTLSTKERMAQAR